MRARFALSALLILLLALLAVPASAFDTCPTDAEIQVLWNGTWYDAVFEAGPDTQGRCQIGYEGYGDEWDEWVGAERVRQAPGSGASASATQPSSGLCVVDALVQVLWQGAWYDATVEETRADGQCYIGYNGWDDEWDEWVGPERMRATDQGLCVVGAEIQVLWQNRYYDATVEQRRADGQCYIGYDGYGDEWDEWVGPERVRSRPQ